MTFTVLILPRAQKQLARTPSPSFERVRDATLALASNPRPHGRLKLSGRDGWRIRLGDCQVINEIDDSRLTVTVLDVGNRRDVYR
jgi:mRNA interferase RelE/StbE